MPRIVKFSYSWYISLLNKLLHSRIPTPLNANALRSKAQKVTGLDDFGSVDFYGSLERQVEDLNENAPWHGVGRTVYQLKLENNLKNRLWSEYWKNKKGEEILKPLPNIVLITGLQRTGTTFLQRMLGSLDDFHGLKTSELVNPVPISRSGKYRNRLIMNNGDKFVNTLNPDFKKIHSVSANQLDEEVVLMDHSFMSTITESVLRVPNYSRWLETQSQILAYEDLKMWLQFLLWRRPASIGSTLLLKAPQHMEYLDDFLTVFPQTKIVQMHRDPSETLPSFCNMVLAARKMFCREADSYEIGQHWLRKNYNLLTNCMKTREQKNDLFFDVDYREFTENPFKIVEDIYSWLGMEWTDSKLDNIKRFSENHKKNKYGKHQYDMNDFNLSKEEIFDKYSSYINQYLPYLSQASSSQKDIKTT